MASLKVHARSIKASAAAAAAKPGKKAVKVTRPTHVTPYPKTEQQPSVLIPNDALKTPSKPADELTHAQLGSIIGLVSVTEAVFMNGECACYIGAAAA
jgi:hypothetical protein